LAFSAGPDGGREIYIIGVDGRNLKQLTAGGDNLDPSFSPDGKWISFRKNRDGKNEIYVIRRNGGQETRLTGAASSNWQPHWGK
jgi:TolB protein